MTAPVLSVRNLKVQYGDAMAVDDVSFEVAEHECVTVLGPNGAGKSSIAKAILSLAEVTGGSIEINGHPATGESTHKLAREGVAYLPEGRGIFPTLTVAENLKLGVRVLPKNERDAAADRAYVYFPILKERRKQIANTMSGGEQQMLAVSRALVTGPKLLVADEISLGLAPLVIETIYGALVLARQEGVTVLLIEQYVDRALEFADRAVVLRRGVVAWEGPADSNAAAVVHGYLESTGLES